MVVEYWRLCWIGPEGKFMNRTAAIVGGIVMCVAIGWKVKREMRKRKLKNDIAQRQKERWEIMEKLKNEVASGMSVERHREILEMKFDQLNDQLRKGKYSPSQVLQAYQWKALQSNDSTNCVCLFFPKAIEWAKELDKLFLDGKIKSLPLFGIPVSVKESLTVEGYDSTRGYAQSLFQPAPQTAAIVSALQRLGAIPFVHTNIPQGLLWFGCSNPIYGTTSNPCDMNKTCGGSSGGEAALIASGGSIVGIGTDVGGSIRIPSHFCGIVGFKISSNRISQLGSLPSVPGRQLLSASNGFMTGEVASVVNITRHVVSNEKLFEDDPYVKFLPWREEMYNGNDKKILKIGYYDYDGFVQATPACRRAVEEAKRILVKKGHELVQFQPTNTEQLLKLCIGAACMDGCDYLYKMAVNDIIDGYYAPLIGLFAIPSSMKRLIGYLVRPFSPLLSAVLLSAPCSLTDLRSIYEEIENARLKYVDDWKSQSIDCLICPAFACTALPHDIPAQLSVAVSYTMVFNLMDFVAGVVPITRVNANDELDMIQGGYEINERFSKIIFKNCSKNTIGSPVGVQCVAMPNQEERCLRLMKEIEEGIGRV